MRTLVRPFLIAVMLASLGRAGTAHSAPTPPPLPPCLQATGTAKCYSPAEIRSFYGVDSLINAGTTGRGRTIAIVVSYGSPTIVQDLHTFDAAFNLPDPTVKIVAPLGEAPPTDHGWVLETSLDVEWAHALAPDARILLLTSPVNETEGTQGLPEFLALLRYAKSHGADVISQSWGATEETLMTKKGRAMVNKLHHFYAEATKKRISLVTGSGDGGTTGLDQSMQRTYPFRVAQYPASDPYVLSVGGTTLSVGADGSRGEVAWPFSGGGVSKLFPEPAYQRGLPKRLQTFLHGHRGYPDVAYDGSPESAVPIVMNGQWYRGAGTSAGTPQWAGILALADSAAGKRVGDIHSAIYSLARGNRYHTDFHDITTGSIKDPPELTGKEQPLKATAGWDPATGLGSPNTKALVADLIKKTG